MAKLDGWRLLLKPLDKYYMKLLSYTVGIDLSSRWYLNNLSHGVLMGLMAGT